MSPEQRADIMDKLHEVKAWAGGLLDKCAQLERLVESSGAVSTVPPRQPSVLSFEERAAIAAAQRKRLIRKRA